MDGKRPFVKYPKALADAEITSSKTLQGDISDIITREKVTLEQLHRASFSLAGAYPYIFDALTALCSDNPDIQVYDFNTEQYETVKVIQRHGLFYTATLKWETFLQLALDGMEEGKQTLIDEICKMYSNRVETLKCVPLPNSGYSVTCRPIDIKAIYHKDQTTASRAEMRGLINLDLHPISAITFDFFVPLFKATIESRGSTGFFKLTRAFHAKMLHTMNKYRNTETFTKYGNIKTMPVTYRRYQLFLGLHDNNKAPSITIPEAEIAIHIMPSDVDTSGNLKDPWRVRTILTKANALLNAMAKEGYMEFMDAVPRGVYYHREIRAFEIFLHRQRPMASVPDFSVVGFTDKAGELPQPSKRQQKALEKQQEVDQKEASKRRERIF